MKYNPAIDFYKTGVHSVLKRYEFSPEEKEIIQAAILTARKPQPNMKLIEKADALLKRISETRQPIASTEDEPDARKVAAAQAYYSTTGGYSGAGKEDRNFKVIMMFLAGMGLLVALTVYIIRTH